MLDAKNTSSQSGAAGPINGIRTGNFLSFASISFSARHSSPYLIHDCLDVDPNKIYSVLACDGRTGEQKEISYSNLKAVGNGSFGVVFQAKILETGDLVAIKKVLQDKRFKVSGSARQYIMQYWGSLFTF
jgi:hypothetical protein